MIGSRASVFFGGAIYLVSSRGMIVRKRLLLRNFLVKPNFFISHFPATRYCRPIYMIAIARRGQNRRFAPTKQALARMLSAEAEANNLSAKTR
jgi:hypothetical protein